MSLDRQIVRLMAAMILAIIAYVAPSAVQAHEGHAHHVRPQSSAALPKVVVPTAKVVAPVAAKLADRAKPAWSKVALLPSVTEGARIEPTRGDCCPAGCTARCCGTMACGAAGILSGPSDLAPTLFRTVILIPRDVAGRSGPGPEALPKPPRTLA